MLTVNQTPALFSGASVLSSLHVTVYSGGVTLFQKETLKIFTENKLV